MQSFLKRRCHHEKRFYKWQNLSFCLRKTSSFLHKEATRRAYQSNLNFHSGWRRSVADWKLKATVYHRVHGWGWNRVPHIRSWRLFQTSGSLKHCLKRIPINILTKVFDRIVFKMVEGETFKFERKLHIVIYCKLRQPNFWHRNALR